MRILLMTKSAELLGLANRLSLEGHQVSVFSERPLTEKSGKDLWKRCNIAKLGIRDCQFIISDMQLSQDLWNFARLYNKPVVGFHPVADLLNGDAVKEFEASVNCGCAYPFTQIFDDAVDVGELIIGWDAQRYYIKHARRVIDCDYDTWLTWAMYNLPYGERVLVQEQLMGDEVSVMGWFDGIDWRRPFVLCNTDSTRLGATVMWRDEDDKMSELTIEPLKTFLQAINYRGPVKCHLLATPDYTYLVRIKIGFTYPDLYAYLEGLKERTADFMWSIAFGRQTDVSYTRFFSVALETVVNEADMDGAPLTGVQDQNLSHVFMHDVHMDSGSYFIDSGFTKVYTAAARGDHIDQASGRAYRTIGLLTFPCMGYPTNMRYHFNMLHQRVGSNIESQFKKVG